MELLAENPYKGEIIEKFGLDYARVLKHRIKKKVEQMEEDLELFEEAKEAFEWKNNQPNQHEL